MTQYTLKQRCLCEFLSTYCLVVIGCGAIVVNAKTELLTHVGVATVWGLIVMVMIYSTAHISGCHMNPSVTIALTAIRRMPVSEAGAYIVAQCLGATVGAYAIAAVLGNELGEVGSTTTSIGLGAGLAVEFMMTAILMFVVMGVSLASDAQITGGLAVGSTIAMEAFVAGPLTKASMNPARSLGPAIVANSDSLALNQLWLYIAGPIAGALCAVVLFKALQPKNEEAPDASTAD